MMAQEGGVTKKNKQKKAGIIPAKLHTAIQ
jgi:hypothetical protein